MLNQRCEKLKKKEKQQKCSKDFQLHLQVAIKR